MEHNSTSIPPSLHHPAASFPTSNLATCRELLKGPGWSLNRRTEARREANRKIAVINTRDMEEIKGKFWWVGPLHVMTEVNINGIYKPLEVHVERSEFNFYMKSKLKTSISYLLGVCGPMESKQFVLCLICF